MKTIIIAGRATGKSTSPLGEEYIRKKDVLGLIDELEAKPKPTMFRNFIDTEELKAKIQG